ncbi:MAG: apolipoprotein N-acyltransferase [Candidatus Omnitrophota bacterium]
MFLFNFKFLKNRPGVPSALIPWLALVSVLLLRLSFPRAGFWPLAWFAFLPLFLALEKTDTAKTLGVSFAAGFVFYISLLFWLIHVTIPGMAVLSFYLALYFAVFGLGWNYARAHLSYGARLVFSPCLWVLLEYIRSHLFTGFPWGLLAYTQTPCIPALQGADLVGSWGLSFVIVFVNVFLFEVLFPKMGERRSRLAHAAPLCLIALWFLYGAWRAWEKPREQCFLKVAVVQGNIPQEIKWAPRFREGIFRKHVLLSEISLLKHEPDLIVWPETSFTEYLELGENDGELADLARRLKTPLLIGSIRFDEGRYFNSALLYDSAGEMRTLYNKLHLVPFGEYIPGRKFLPFVESVLPIEDFTPGSDATLFSLPSRTCLKDLRFGVLVCFEDIFPELARAFVLKGADFLVNMTNDGWFGDTSSPFQHMQASVLRAVENRVYVVRSANTGVSCVIDDAGRVVSLVDEAGRRTFVKGEACGFVAPTPRSALYTVIGDLFIPFACAGIFGMIGARRRRP